ncbi:MAG TPA: hypothetical protein ENJ19_00600 [Gammaproteobacteria bacterium]|nr:hypothetical protein [Gammaproteobacteria bacterium]
MNKHTCFFPTAQRGSVLIVSLLILIVMSLIGLTAARTSTMEERMAGNSRDRGLAFEASETALRDAEAYLNTIVAITDFDGSGGLYGEDDTEPDYTAAGTWSSTGSVEYSGTIDGVNSKPRYIIKHVGTVTGDSDNLTVSGYGAYRSGDVDTFRVTARGTGATDTATVLLQSHFGRQF